ncbi:type VI secretion system contractile sheath large subunit [Gallaecimonas pentaromativorans]|uniref:type VI secretion system contractile sheath large subunit n=1 Tax=Gallaecimonas pentaromativorans TaxID=584787 RepID=UPI003A8F29FB
MNMALQFVAKDYLEQPEPVKASPLLPMGFMARVAAEPDELKALLMWLGRVNPEKNWTDNSVKALLTKTLVKLDELINAQLNAILHHPELQAVEANWRGLWLLTEQAAHDDSEGLVKIRVLDLNWAELSKDLTRAIEFDQSRLFQKIYSNEFGMPGGEPFGVLIGAYSLSHRSKGGQSNLDTLKELSRVSAAAFAPVVLNAEPSFFGVDEFADLTGMRELSSYFSSPELAKWRALREMDDSRFLALAMPRVMMRPPYRGEGEGPEAFRFIESRANPQRDFLWGPASFAAGTVIIRAFCESGWFANIRGYQRGRVTFGAIDNLPAIQNLTRSGAIYQTRTPVEWQVSDRLERMLAEEGFLPLLPLTNTEMLVLHSAASVQAPRHYDNTTAQLSARLSTMLHYTLCVSRFAHFLKVMGRDRVGGYSTPEECESFLQRWLHGYTMASEGASDEMRARFPLREAKVTVRERPGEPGRYYSIIRLQPHFQLDQLVTGVKLITELTPVNGA